MKLWEKRYRILVLFAVGILTLTACNRTPEEEDYDYSWYIELWSKQLEPILTGEELEQLEVLEWDEKIRPYMEYDWVGDEGLLSIDFSGASSWTFQLADLNQDGQPEMLVSLSQYARSLPDFIRVYTIQDGTVIYCGAIDGGWRRLELKCELEYFPSYYVDVYQKSTGEFRYLSCEYFYNYNEYNYYQFYESTFDGTTVSCQPVYAIRYLADEIEGVTDQRYMAGDCTEWDMEKWETGMDDEMYSAFRQAMKEYMQGYEKVDIDFTLSQYEMPGLAFRLPSEQQEMIRDNIVASFAQALGYMEGPTAEDASANDVTAISVSGKEELAIENGSIQQEIISGNFEHLEGEFTDGDTYSEYMTEWYSRRKEELEWQHLDLNGDGIEDLILQEKSEVGEMGHHEIVAIFACDKDSASCVLLDMNDMTAYYFCGPAGELMYSASSYVPLVSCEPYTHCYYDKEWNLIKDYKLIIYYVYDVGEDSEYPEQAEKWRENHPDMAEHGVYFQKVTDAGEEALTQEEFTEIYETVTGLKLYSSFFH